MRKFLLLLVVAVLASFTVACSSSEGSDGSDTTETTESVDGAQDTPAPTADTFEEAFMLNLTEGDASAGYLVLPDAEAECVAASWAEVAAPDGDNQAGATPDEVADPDFSYLDLGLDADQAQAMVDTFGDCDVDIVAQVASSLTTSLTEEQQACVAENMDVELTEQILLTSFTADLGTGDEEFAQLTSGLSEACDLPG